MQTGCTLWFTGMSGSGKSTVSALVAKRLRDIGHKVELLDGDIMRTQLCRDLGFSKEHREENVRRVAFVCELLSRNGVIAVAALISPYRAGRDEARARIPNFFEVHMNCPLDVLIRRDTKGLYQKALAGDIPNFTGISDPYEPPLAPELTIDTSSESPEESVERIISGLQDLGLLISASTPRPVV